MDNIIVLDHFFNLTKKSKLTVRLNTIFDNLVVAYFLGHPVDIDRFWLECVKNGVTSGLLAFSGQTFFILIRKKALDEKRKNSRKEFEVVGIVGNRPCTRS